jgi:hypothetical protein
MIAIAGLFPIIRFHPKGTTAARPVSVQNCTCVKSEGFAGGLGEMLDELFGGI